MELSRKKLTPEPIFMLNLIGNAGVKKAISLHINMTSVVSRMNDAGYMYVTYTMFIFKCRFYTAICFYYQSMMAPIAISNWIGTMFPCQLRNMGI